MTRQRRCDLRVNEDTVERMMGLLIGVRHKERALLTRVFHMNIAPLAVYVVLGLLFGLLVQSLTLWLLS